MRAPAAVHNSSVVTSAPASGWVWWCGWVVVAVGVGVSRVLFENCTVDASIFVVKFVRAHGGCLGTRSR